MSENYSFRSAMNGFNRNDVIAYIDSIIKDKSDALDRISALESQIAELKSNNETLRGIIVDESKKNEVADKCAECDVAKVYEARLGAAMLDAKRFSEILVKEANDKASELFAKAYSSADTTSQKAINISKNVIEINNQFNNSFKVLLENMNSLTKSLEAFKAEVKDTGSVFDFSTDFVPINQNSVFDNNNQTKEVSHVNSSINFDDADEFDIRVDV